MDPRHLANIEPHLMMPSVICNLGEGGMAKYQDLDLDPPLPGPGIEIHQNTVRGNTMVGRL